MTEEKQLTKDGYHELFLKNKDISREALKQALEIRKFEIELYWKRATYFWTFIGAAFVAYGVFYNAATKEGSTVAANWEHVLVLIACIGFVFSLAWHYVNKGSKFWQENWENHVALLEDAHIGPLYKSWAERPAESTPSKLERIEDFFVAPAPFSVSKINQLVSTFVATIWALILFASVGELNWQYELDFKKVVPITLTFLTWLAFLLIGKSHQGDHHPDVHLRKVIISEQGNSFQDMGKTVCENRGLEVPAEQHTKGVTPPKNETHVDHVVPNANGGIDKP